MTTATTQKKKIEAIEIKAETVYIADSYLREIALLKRKYPSGVEKIKEGLYRGFLY